MSVQLLPPTTIEACCDEVIRRMSRGVPKETALSQVLAQAKLSEEEQKQLALRGLIEMVSEADVAKTEDENDDQDLHE